MLTILLAVSAAAADLPKFTFRDIVAGEPVDAKSFAYCGKRSAIIRECKDYLGKVAGKDASITSVTNNGLLYSLTVIFSHNDYDELLRAFSSKYGQPCKEEVGEVQNRMGAKFPERNTLWCFATGKMLLKEYVDDLNTSGAIYRDDKVEAPPASSPKVDF